jgi:lysophosphatidylcholine acyltransferase/lyso-PAF acetyltransferase
MATAQEAPVIVASPHSSFYDAFIVPLLNGPSVVARLESSKTPFFGKLMDFTQAIYVDRDSPDSRFICKNEIRRRVQSQEGWPQVFIFPEGTCTNRSALAQFKLGAFQPGVPVQPVVVRYPNRCDCLTWTFDGPSGYVRFFVFYITPYLI